MRRKKSLGDLTGFSGQPVQPRIGRPTYLRDGQLHNRRDQLVQVFEGMWGEIGYELLKCNKPNDLIRILNPLKETYARDIFSVICRKSTEPASAANLREVRRKCRAITEPKLSADVLRGNAQERLQRVDWALGQAQEHERTMVEQEQNKRRKEFAEADQAYRRLAARERDLQLQLFALEPSFARQEVFDFLKSGRYALTPLSIANAMAGLPYMGWRQSMRRSVAEPRVSVEGLDYQIFKAIRYLAESPDKRTPKALIVTFREQIPVLPSRYRLARSELVEKWFYLERAIRRAYGLKLRRKELPFAIAKQYFLQLRTQSQVDRVLAEQAKLSPPRTRRPRISSSE